MFYRPRVERLVWETRRDAANAATGIVHRPSSSTPRGHDVDERDERERAAIGARSQSVKSAFTFRSI